MTSRHHTATISEVRAAFPKWVLWQSDHGRYWATSPGNLTKEQEHAGCALTVDADNLQDLAEVLAEQEQLRERP